MVQARHQASVSQLRDIVGKLGGLQAEHRAVQLRESPGVQRYKFIMLNRLT